MKQNNARTFLRRAEALSNLHFDGGWPKEKAEALAKAEMESHIRSLERAELIAAGEA